MGDFHTTQFTSEVNRKHSNNLDLKAKNNAVIAARTSVELLQPLKTSVAEQEKLLREYLNAKDKYNDLLAKYTAACKQESQLKIDNEENDRLIKKIKLNEQMLDQFHIAIKQTENYISEADKNKNILSTLNPSQTKEEQARIKNSFQVAVQDTVRLKEQHKTLCAERQALIDQNVLDKKAQKALLETRAVFPCTTSDLEILKANANAAKKELVAFGVVDVAGLTFAINDQRKRFSEANERLANAQHALAETERQKKKEEAIAAQIEQLNVTQADLCQKVQNISPTESAAKVANAAEKLNVAEQNVASVKASLQRIEDYRKAKADVEALQDQFNLADQEFERMLSQKKEMKSPPDDFLRIPRSNRDKAKAALLTAKETRDATFKKLSPDDLALINNLNGDDKIQAQLNDALAVQATANKEHTKAAAEQAALEQTRKELGRIQKVKDHLGAPHTTIEKPQQRTEEKTHESFLTKASEWIKKIFNSVGKFFSGLFNSLHANIISNKENTPKQGKKQENVIGKSDQTVITAPLNNNKPVDVVDVKAATVTSSGVPQQPNAPVVLCKVANNSSSLFGKPRPGQQRKPRDEENNTAAIKCGI